MEYCNNTFKMIIHMGVFLIFTQTIHCYPHPERFHLPEIPVLSAEEVNSLEQSHPIQRSIKPTLSNSNNIDSTVKEVEAILNANPALPRLTRGEILDILENITNVDATKAHYPGNRDPKAIMVVMPFTPSNTDNQNIEDLYTKPPVTHIIGGEPFTTTQDEKKTKHNRRRPAVTYAGSEEIEKKPTGNDDRKKYEFRETKRTTTSPRTPVRRRRPEVTTVKPDEIFRNDPVTTYRPRMVPSTYRPRQEISSTYRSTRRPVRRRTTTSTTIQPEVITYRNHRYSDEKIKFVPSDGIRIVNSPKLALPSKINDDLMTDLNVDYDTKHEVILKSDLALAPITTSKPIEFQVTTTQKPVLEETPITHDINVPESLKNLMENMNLESALNPKPISNEPSLEEQKKIKEMLAAIGAFTTTATTTTVLPNAENVAESLSPDMRDLLMSFGLLANPNSTPAPVAENSAYLPDKAEVKPESYVGFKPLPEEGPGRQDMDELLASFGLGRSGRKEKSLKNSNNVNKDEKEINLDVVPENFKNILSDIGLATRQEKKIRSPTKEKTLEKQHVFSPDSQYASEEELKKLDKLIGMVKQLEQLNGTVNEEDLKKLDLSGLRDLVQSLNSYKEPLTTLDELENGPDPNSFDSGLSKNEVKRQKTTEKSVSTSISIVEAVTEASTTTTTTTEEPRTPNIKDLEASFGGQSEVSVVSTEAPLPETTTARRNGFYYLVDWNTFLDIDDTKGRRVNLRFQPTIGDPKRFLSVSVP